MLRAGVFVVSPYNAAGPTMDAADVRRALEVELLAGRHVAYVEKDASVDHLRLVTELTARDTNRLVIFRNVTPRGLMCGTSGVGACPGRPRRR
jgi:hypothetical protein